MGVQCTRQTWQVELANTGSYVYYDDPDPLRGVIRGPSDNHSVRETTRMVKKKYNEKIVVNTVNKIILGNKGCTITVIHVASRLHLVRNGIVACNSRGRHLNII